MNNSAMLKIAGILVIPFILMIVGAFFLYPQLNEDKYNEIASTFEEQQEANFENELQSERNGYTSIETDSQFNGAEVPDSLQTADYQTIMNVQRLEENEVRLHDIIDSLHTEIENMEIEIEELKNMVEEEAEVDPEEFNERVKSLLNLEEDELSPILEKMSNEQIVRLYYSGGTIQRQKILRSLDADKAAEIMSEIML